LRMLESEGYLATSSKMRELQRRITHHARLEKRRREARPAD
jgi:hypothetical protein